MIWRATIPVLALVLSACSERLPEYELSGASMGTSFSIKLVAPDSAIDRDRLQQEIKHTLLRIENRMSTYAADSELSRFNASNSTGWSDVSTELCGIIESAIGISRLTGGAFDITIGPLVNLWGFGPHGNIAEPPSATEISRARQTTGFEKLDTNCSVPAIRKLQPDVYVDLSAYAKGYAVDQLAELLDKTGLTDYIVEIGGELRIRGRNASGDNWAIAVEKPLAGLRDVQTVIHPGNSAVATSGDYRIIFEYGGNRYSHIIDPRTGRPAARDVAAVTVVSDRAAFADAVATALVVMGLDRGLVFAEREGIAAYFLVRTESGIVEHMTSMFSLLPEP